MLVDAVTRMTPSPTGEGLKHLIRLALQVTFPSRGRLKTPHPSFEGYAFEIHLPPPGKAYGCVIPSHFLLAQICIVFLC